MKNSKKLLGFVVAFIVVMVTFCSVSFAEYNQYTENLIPTMTSNTSPSGIVTASNELSYCQSWKAFDKNITHIKYGPYYTWGVGTTSGWLSYEFPLPQIITRYTIHTQTYFGIDSFPKTWTFEAWNGTTWVTLDTRSNVTNWINGVKKEFIFDNSNSYIKYRINITATVAGNTSWLVKLVIGELEMMGPAVAAPTNLTATAGDAKVDLKWDAVEGATSYNIKSTTTTPGGIYTTIATSSAITYTDTSVTNGTTYYYVVTAVNAGGEGGNSNEASATPINPAVTLEITSVDTAKVGGEINANVVIHNAANVCAEDIKIAFDTTRLDFISAEGADGIKIYRESDLTDGILRYITASLGKENAANGDKILLKLVFKAKSMGEAKIDIINGRIADNATLEMDVEYENCGEKTVLIEGINDVNRSGEFTLLDLGIDAWYFWEAASNTDTTKYDTDVIVNGTIDEYDVTEIVNQILNNNNYPTPTN